MEPLIGGKYSIEEHLGSGSYGDVYRALDVENQIDVALKFVNKKKNYREARIMEALQNQDHVKGKYIARLLDQFSHENNQVYAIELLYIDLYKASKMRFKDGYDLKTIASIGLQLCQALRQFNNMAWRDRKRAFLIHGDLKIDNVMFADESCTSIKIIDFGLAFFHHERRYETTQTRTTRAPESLFNGKTRQTPAVDMWSVGVLLFTLLKRRDMWKSSSDEEQMANLVYAFGEPPLAMMENNKRLAKYFDRDGDELSLKSKYKNKASRKYSFDKMFERAVAAPIHEEMRATVWMRQFKDLLLWMFEYDPNLRITPCEAIRHPFFKLVKKHSGFTEPFDKLKI